MDKRKLAPLAVKAAVRLRLKQNISANSPICPYDLALGIGVKVRFGNTPSLEGMYSPTPTPAIILGAERPAGRRRYTCAHEIGHHVFEHGAKLDELDGSDFASNTLDEFLAQRFAAALLMPNPLLTQIFKRAEIAAKNITPEQAYVVSREIGVGYTTLLTHLSMNTNMISTTLAKNLKSVPVQTICAGILGHPHGGDLFVIGPQTIRRVIDVDVGDIILLPGTFDCLGDALIHENGYAEAVRQGVGSIVTHMGVSYTVRVSRKFFIGDARYRHFEDPDNE